MIVGESKERDYRSRNFGSPTEGYRLVTPIRAREPAEGVESGAHIKSVATLTTDIVCIGSSWIDRLFDVESYPLFHGREIGKIERPSKGNRPPV